MPANNIGFIQIYNKYLGFQKKMKLFIYKMQIYD